MATRVHPKLRNNETGLAVEVFIDGALKRALAVSTEPMITLRPWVFDHLLFVAEGLLDTAAQDRQVINIWAVEQGRKQELIALYDSKFGRRWFVK